MNVKVFLIHPTFDTNASHTLVYRKGYGTAIPLGLAYIAASLSGAGYQVRVYDFQVERNSVHAEVETFRPDVIGISVTTPAAGIAAGLAGQLKEKYPNLPIIAGGPHPSILKEKTFQETSNYDYLVVGEGEATILELLQAICGDRPLREVRGICYRDGAQVIQTPPREFMPDLDRLPRLPVELFKFRRYIPTPGTFIHLPSVAFLTSRGCPFHCVFCNKSMFGDTIRQMSARRIVDEIVELKERCCVREFNFYDDTFTVDRHRVLEFCDLLRSRKVDIKWKCNSRVNTVTRDMLMAMRQAGCFSISFGVESGDDRILKKIRKSITTAEVRDAFRWSKEAGISRAAFFMLNLPGDTRETVEKTIRFSREIRPDFISFELTKPLPGSAIREALAGEANLRINEALWQDWDSCSISNKVFFTQNDLTEEYLMDAFMRAVKPFYFSPIYIASRLARIRSWAQFRSYAAAALNIFLARVSGSVR
jgi:anaerobic magnesium-protoporphyrin IX monomethyl ester cyclase